MTDINRLISSLKRRSAHAKEFGHDVLFVKLEDIDALVEVLEKAQSYIDELREWNAGLAQESFERQQRISEIEPIRTAAEKLVRCKGRYHSEQNYRALASLFGVKTPDLPPLDSESRTVTVKLPKRSVGEVMHMSGFSRDYAEGWCSGNDNAIHEMRAAGIKVEAE